MTWACSLCTGPCKYPKIAEAKLCKTECELYKQKLGDAGDFCRTHKPKTNKVRQNDTNRNR